MQSLVVAGQAALGVVLILAAGASVARLVDLLEVDPGFRPDGAVTLRVPISDQRYASFEERVGHLATIEEALRALPGVSTVGSTDVLPVGDPGVNWALSIEDHPPEDPDAFEVARGRLVTAGYLDALGATLLEGRGLTAGDDARSTPVVVVSRAFASRYWPDASAVGRRIKRRTYDGPFPWMTVVGVVSDMRDGGLDADVGPTVYFPYAQQDTRLGREMSVVVRGEGDPGALLDDARAALARVDSRTPLVRAVPLASLLDASIAPQRASGRMLSVFAAGGLALLALGVYGVMARTVQERTREVGVRMALGARTAEVVAFVLRGGMALLAAGLIAGLVAGPAALRALGAWVDEPMAPPVWAYGLAAALTMGVGLLACGVPTWRAARVDPVRSLKDE